ncbi:MAG: phosphocholine cytidylyltransferase family protein [Polyangiaceae bacterium]|nr:phosphocholine cytidylyltransferase family protein [Polyangiaceae bacterium]
MSAVPEGIVQTPVAVVLVAGQGTRLRPLTDDRPKALVQAGEETILGRAARLLTGAGVRRLVVATGYRADAIRAALEGSPLEVAYCHNPEFETTQNSVSLHRCAEAVGGQSFFKLDGDVLFHPAVLSRLAGACAPLAVAVDGRRAHGRRAGADGPGEEGLLGDEEMKVRVDGAGRITAFGKELPPAACAGESIGIERVDAAIAPALFEALARASAEGRVGLYYEAIYGELIAAGAEARSVDVTDLPWTEVDTLDDLRRARALVASGILDPAPPW